MDQQRIVCFENTQICYTLQRKTVKNINLRVYPDGHTAVSASPKIPAAQVDAFVLQKAKFILNAKQNFAEAAKNTSQPKQYITGATIYILGKPVRLQVEYAPKNKTFLLENCLYLQLRNPENPEKCKQQLKKYQTEQSRLLFQQLILQIAPKFVKYHTDIPTLKVRQMKSRWGSCAPKKGIITLNVQLFQTPISCIEYVIIHEFCHFAYPNHSKQFYSLLSSVLPNWKQQKQILNNFPIDLF